MKTIIKALIGFLIIVGLTGCGHYNKPSYHEPQHKTKTAKFYNGF